MSGADNKRTALITGASRGIGRAVALGLAEAGIHVVALARTQGALEDLDDQIRSIGGQATLLPMDLRKLDEIDKLGPSLYERFGGLDILVGNAGTLGPLSPTHHIDPKDWDKVFKLNLFANLRLIRTLDPLLRAAPSGRAVFTTSDMAKAGTAYWGPYAASKAALNAAIIGYASELEQTNLRVNLVNPGPVDTRMLQEAFPGGVSPDISVSKPEEVAPLYIELCSPECRTHGEIHSISA